MRRSIGWCSTLPNLHSVAAVRRVRGDGVKPRPLAPARTIAVATVRAADAMVIPRPPTVVWGRLADLRGWSRWWPTWLADVRALDVRPGLTDSVLAIWPTVGFSFRWRVERAEAGHLLRLRYHAGPYAGTGEWRLDEAPEGTRVSYHVDATTTHPLLHLASRVLDLGVAHSLLMRAVLAGLREEAIESSPLALLPPR